MNGNVISRGVWWILGLVGLLSLVDLGFGPIVICSQCGEGTNMILGVVLMVIAAVAYFVANRVTVGRR